MLYKLVLCTCWFSDSAPYHLIPSVCTTQFIEHQYFYSTLLKNKSIRIFPIDFVTRHCYQMPKTTYTFYNSYPSNPQHVTLLKVQTKSYKWPKPDFRAQLLKSIAAIAQWQSACLVNRRS